KDRMIQDGPMSAPAVARTAGQIAEALGVAHEHGVIHRDVKPQNVLVTDSGGVKVADFGIALAASATAISGTSVVLGTVRYMSPEQAMGETVGPASDLYSLGVVLYEMLTGELPFEADTPVAVSMKHVNEPPRPPRELNQTVPEGMNALVLRLLAKNPEDRYASAAALVADLDRVEAGLPLAAEAGTAALATAPLLAGPDAPGKGQRRRTPLVLAALVLLLVLGGLAWGLIGGPNVGEIIGSLGDAPDRVREAGGEIERAVAPRDVEVPFVEDLGENEARDRLEKAGLGTVVRSRQSYEEDAGQVLEQSVPAGEKVEEGSRILLAVSSGPGPDDSGGSDGSGGDAGSAFVPPGPSPTPAPDDEDEQDDSSVTPDARPPPQETLPIAESPAEDQYEQ
ncbi:MAG: protein kinase domain-containing protein, partial [Rubrobacter sp.]